MLNYLTVLIGAACLGFLIVLCREVHHIYIVLKDNHTVLKDIKTTMHRELFSLRMLNLSMLAKLEEAPTHFTYNGNEGKLIRKETKHGNKT